MAMTTQEQRILNAAVVALERTTGIHARVRRTRAGRNGLADAIVEIEMDRRKRRFGAEVKLSIDSRLPRSSKPGICANRTCWPHLTSHGRWPNAAANSICRSSTLRETPIWKGRDC